MFVHRISLGAFKGQKKQNKEISRCKDGTLKETHYGKFGQIIEEKTLLRGQLIKDNIYHYGANGQYIGHTKKYYADGNEYTETVIHNNNQSTRTVYINGKVTNQKTIYPPKNEVEAPPLDIEEAEENFFLIG